MWACLASPWGLYRLGFGSPSPCFSQRWDPVYLAWACDAKWKESFTIATECANLSALCVPQGTFMDRTFGFIYIIPWDLMTHCVVRRAIWRCKCRDLVLANFCIFLLLPPITERGEREVWANRATKVTSRCSVLLNFSETFSLTTRTLLSVVLKRAVYVWCVVESTAQDSLQEMCTTKVNTSFICF